MSKQKSQTYVFGAVILMLSNVLVKVIGAVFKIPLTNTIGVDGMAYFNAAYSIYVSLYMISTAGLPVAISRMVAASNSRGNLKEVNRIFTIALRLFVVIGLAGTVVMIAFSRSFATFSKLTDSYLAMIAIAPTLFFICLSSAARGYFQGLQNMVPTAVSNILEAVGKLGIGLLSAWYFYIVKHYELPLVAAFVISGVTIGVIGATVYIYIVKARYHASSEYKQRLAASTDMPVRTWQSLLRELIVTAIPIVLASSIMGLTNTIDTFIMARRLVEAGITEAAAASFYGTYSSMVVPLFNMIPPLIYPFAIGIIPALSAAIAAGKKEECAGQMESAFRMASIIAFPCAIGMGVLSENIISFLYRTEAIDTGSGQVTTLTLASEALSVISCSIFFLGIIAITNSILQAHRYERKTILSTTTGIVVKLIMTYLISGIPGIGILGSAIGTALCYLTIMSMNLYFVIRYTGFVPQIRRVFLKPLISGILCGVVAWGIAYALSGHLPAKLVTLASIACAALVYVVVLLFIKGINRAEVLMLPKGEKICAFLEKRGWLGK